MILYVITYDDGDYYCEGNHCWGIYSTREKAQARIEILKKLPDDAMESRMRNRNKEFAIAEWTLDEDVKDYE